MFYDCPLAVNSKIERSRAEGAGFEIRANNNNNINNNINAIPADIKGIVARILQRLQI